ncbi:50S ribosomal protein L25 [Endozoicomonas montiporae]|uniref:Large ribosomal subunit protein bL25 n=2 Tax=Endozoicomonas montiporae TaxID=1027273 RepID=A0A081N4J2_9GAMM|nr:50S ribosomal protein L25/general stress protein Ctc [Endozoicomonas montiporae]AMO57773.1 50S ribosomal protein L25 [Endozoicomonas montiporae CL-33]KEQ13365.1 50S ribosomal protein L25 [Endozoicomonas montiporae]
MSEAIILSAVARKDVGKGASRRLRHEDKVPAIIYGGEAEPMQVTLQGKAVRKALEAESFYSQIVTLDIEGTDQQVILKDVQRHPAKEYAMHMDFLRVDATHAVTTHVPLHFINEDSCVGVKAGGAINHARVEVEVKCLPADLPEFIEVDMAAVELGGHVHLSDLTLPEGVQLVALLQGEGHDLDVASVQKTRGAAEEDEASEEEAGEE